MQQASRTPDNISRREREANVTAGFTRQGRGKAGKEEDEANAVH